MITSATHSHHIRPAFAQDHPRLLALWQGSVERSHTFLNAAQVEALIPEVQAALALPEMQVFVVSTTLSPHQCILGFLGLYQNKVEMLFMDANARGQGLGTMLLNFAQHLVCKEHQILLVDVNEQNPTALGFYLNYGFNQVGRSSHDDAGRPFPLLHLEFHCTNYEYTNALHFC